MSRSCKACLRTAIAVAAGICCLVWNGEVPMAGSGSAISEAQARIGRPATPLSYAGVARRTTRRAVAAGAATAPIYAPPPQVTVAPAPTCYQAVDAYGRIYYRCP